MDGRLDGPGPVRRGDTGADAVAGVDGHREGRTVPGGVVLDHQGELQALEAVGQHGQADHATPVAGHEGNRRRRDVLGGDAQIAFVFARFVVTQNQHFPLSEVVQRFLCRRKWHRDSPLQHTGMRLSMALSIALLETVAERHVAHASRFIAL